MPGNGEDVLARIDFVSEHERELFAEAHLGELSRNFLATDTGRYLHGRANAEIDKCKIELLALNPHEKGFREKYQAIQQNAWAAEHFLMWMVEVLNNGEHANAQLQKEAEEEV